MGAELRPVALGLAAGRGLEAHHRLFAADAIGQGEVLEDGKAAGIAEGLHLLEQHDGGELRELGQAGKEIVLDTDRAWTAPPAGR